MKLYSLFSIIVETVVRVVIIVSWCVAGMLCYIFLWLLTFWLWCVVMHRLVNELGWMSVVQWIFYHINVTNCQVIWVHRCNAEDIGLNTAVLLCMIETVSVLSLCAAVMSCTVQWDVLMFMRWIVSTGTNEVQSTSTSPWISLLQTTRPSW